MLRDFKSYSLANEMYAIGFVLPYIFSGREALMAGAVGAAPIVQKCAYPDSAHRYQSVLEREDAGISSWNFC